MELDLEQPDIVSQAFSMSAAVARFAERARLFYYAVMLSGHVCPKCGGALAMLKEALCHCQGCGYEFDPTLAFQECGQCGSRPRLVVRRYCCSRCEADIPSRFLFDGLVFDPEYFRQKMAESRERRHELRERVRQMLMGSRSEPAATGAADLTSIPGLIDALNALTQAPQQTFLPRPAISFNLNRYQAHINAHIGPFPVGMDEIPPLSENRRLDRIWRFIAIIFLAHAGILDVWQNGQEIMVMQREADTERQGVPGELEEADGIEGAVG